MADACIIDAFAIYSHYLQVIYEVVYTVAKQFNNGGEPPTINANRRACISRSAITQTQITCIHHQHHTSVQYN